MFAASTLFQQLVAVGLSIIAARMVGAADYGALSVSRNFFVIALIVAPLGIDLAVLRIVGSRDAIFARVDIAHLRAFVFLCNTLIVAVFALGLSRYIANDIYHIAGLSALLTIAITSLPFAADTAILTQAFRAEKILIKPTLISYVVQPCVRALLSLALLQFGYGAVSVLIGTLAGYVTSCVTLGIMYRAQVAASQQQRWLPSAIRGSLVVLKFSLWLATSVFVYSVLRNCDVLLLGLFAPAKAVGAYAAISMFAQMIQIIPQSISQTLGPRVAMAFENRDSEHINSIVSGYLKQASILAAPVCVGVGLFGQYLDLLFGSGFSFNALICSNLAFGYYVAGVLAPMGFALSMTGHHRIETLLLAIGTVIVVLFGYALTAALGENGTALAVTSGFLFINLGRGIVVQRSLGFQFLRWSLLHPLALATAPAIIIVLTINNFTSRRLIDVIVALALYLMIVGAFFWMLYFRGASLPGKRSKPAI